MFRRSQFTKERSERVVEGRLAKLPFAGHPALRVRADLEGFKDYTFGMRAGPSISPRQVFHELAHAAQFGPAEFSKRCTKGGFVFKRYHQIQVMGERCSHPLTVKAIQRELETFAYELHLLRAVGYRVSEEQFFYESANLMKYMPDWFLVPGKSDEHKSEFCKKAIKAYFNQLDSKTVLTRLEGWLNLTAKRLRKTPLQTVGA